MRIWFSKSDSPDRLVRGESIRRLQLALLAADVDPKGADGVFGGDTEAALKTWQRKNKHPVTGTVGEVEWQSLMGTKAPDILDRALQVTADFEGHGFTKIAGNFDGAGLTWGVIGFTLKHGELSKLVLKAYRNHRKLVERTFGSLTDELIAMMKAKWPEQRKWANAISVGPNKYRVDQEWEDAFARFGALDQVQALQMAVVENPFWKRARKDAKTFGLDSELGIALAFDIAVQNGGISESEGRSLRAWMKRNPNGTARQRRAALGEIIAKASNPKWAADVRSRKLTLATGTGTVHQSRYRIENWGLTDVAP